MLLLRALSIALAAMAFLPSQAHADEIAEIVGLWQGEGACGAGYDVRFEMSIYPEADENGNNAVVRIGDSDGARINATVVLGRIFDNGEGRANLTFEPADPVPLVNRTKEAPSMKGRQISSGIALRPLGDLRCGDVKFELASTDPDPANAEPNVATVPEEYAGFLGEWDGAVVDDSGTFVPVSMIIVPAVGGRGDDVFDAVMDYDGQVGTVRLTADERSGYVHFEIAPKDGDKRPLDVTGSFKASYDTTEGRDYFEFYMYNAEKGDGFMMRRPENRQNVALRLLCEQVVTPLTYEQVDARDRSRDLRIAFYPALKDYDGTQSGMAAAAAGVGMSEYDLAVLVHDCIAVGDNARGIAAAGIFDDVIDAQAILEARFALQRIGDIEELVAPRVDAGLSTTSNEATQQILAGLGSPDAYDDVAGILAHVAMVAGKPGFDAIPPQSLATALAPFAVRLDELEAQASVAVSQERQHRAIERMAGIAMPTGLSTKEAQDLQGIADGSKTFFDADDMAYFGGVVAGALEQCDLPKGIEERFMLARLFMQGIDRATFGSTYATGSIQEMLRGSFDGASTYASGASLPEQMGCESPFLPALLANLGDLGADRDGSESGRASLFVRSCSLDRSETQCGCMAEEIRSVIPGIDGLEYDRNQLVAVIQGNPLVAGKLVAMCQVGDY